MKLPWKLMKNLRFRRQNSSQSQHDCGNKKTWQYMLRKCAFEWSGFNRYGLYAHDVIDYEHPVIREALHRLPEDIVDARNFRIIRALQLSFLKTYLPREQWITYEQDLEYRYLEPYIHEINAEWDEIEKFDGFDYWKRDWSSREMK